LAQLTAGIGGKLTLVAAPAGFGKSTLLSDWIGETEATAASDLTGADSTASDPGESATAQTATRAPRPTFCWLSLEESDNDPIRFWLYFIAALQAMNPGLGAGIPILLQSPEPPPLETVLTILLNDLSAWPTEIVPAIILVLEDYHVITASVIHQSLTFFLEHLPPTLHLVMTTRADPPLPLARLRAHGQLAEIRADDLRFSGTETALFLNERMGLQLAPEEVDLLAARTEGWIVGLQLAALSMHGHGDKASFLRSFSGGHRYILNYLIEEVLNQQPKAIQTFLLHTSILTRLSGPLCDAVMDVDALLPFDATSPLPATASAVHPNSQGLLAQLEQANLFLIALDDLGQWYRYHQLFAEVLQHRLRQSQPALLPTLHQRATRWYAAQGYFVDAIQHALLGADFARAAALIEQVWPTLWNQGAIATLFNWMQALPVDSLTDAALWGQPSLYVSYAWGLALTGQIEAAETCLQQVTVTLSPEEGAQPGAPEAAATHQTLLGRAAALRAMLAARRGEAAVAVPLAEQALTLIPNDAPARGDAYYALGLAKQQQGALTAALTSYEAAAELSMAANDAFLLIAARYHKARILMAQGNLHQAATTYQQILAVAAQAKKQLPVVGLAHVGYGEILYQWNDLDAAARQVETGLALSPRRDLTYTDGPLHRFSILARIRQAVGDQAGALAAIGLAKETAQQTGIALDGERAAALDALIQLRLGNLTAAAQWAALYAERRSAAERFRYRHEFETLVFVRILLAQGRVDETLAILTAWLPAVAATPRLNSLLELHLLHALALRCAGHADDAMRTLTLTLTLAEPAGYIRLLVDEGEPMRLALVEWRLAADRQPGTAATLLAYADKLDHAFHAAAPSAPSTTATTTPFATPLAPSATLIEPLTDREIDVLRLVTAGFSNAAIAAQLVVSVGTVKTHLKHIYGKLAVQSRTQAVAQARTLHLL
jgi:LuxR family maltose regulon positive regulatory protein